MLAEGVAEVWRNTRLANIDFAGIAEWLYQMLIEIQSMAEPEVGVDDILTESSIV